MSDHIPPTDAELTWLRWYADECAVPVLARACAEVHRLRELCGRAATDLPQLVAGSTKWDSLVRVLFRASKGKV